MRTDSNLVITRSLRTVTPVPVSPSQDASEGIFDLSLVLQSHDEVISPAELSCSVVSCHRGHGSGLISVRGHEKTRKKVSIGRSGRRFWLRLALDNLR